MKDRYDIEMNIKYEWWVKLINIINDLNFWEILLENFRDWFSFIFIFMEKLRFRGCWWKRYLEFVIWK